MFLEAASPANSHHHPVSVNPSQGVAWPAIEGEDTQVMCGYPCLGVYAGKTPSFPDECLLYSSYGTHHFFHFRSPMYGGCSHTKYFSTAPLECPTIGLNVDTTFLETVSDPTELSPTRRLPPTSDAITESKSPGSPQLLSNVVTNQRFS